MRFFKGGKKEKRKIEDDWVKEGKGEDKELCAT